jgi:hypothetical protein
LFLQHLTDVFCIYFALVRVPLFLGITTTLLFILVFLYLYVYLYYIHSIAANQESWKLKSPYAIPFATLCMVSSGVFYCLAFWPIWNWLTPVVLIVEFLGLVAILSLAG